MEDLLRVIAGICRSTVGSLLTLWRSIRTMVRLHESLKTNWRLHVEITLATSKRIIRTVTSMPTTVFRKNGRNK